MVVREVQPAFFSFEGRKISKVSLCGEPMNYLYECKVDELCSTFTELMGFLPLIIMVPLLVPNDSPDYSLC